MTDESATCGYPKGCGRDGSVVIELPHGMKWLCDEHAAVVSDSGDMLQALFETIEMPACSKCGEVMTGGIGPHRCAADS